MTTPEIQFTTASPPAAALATDVHSHGFTFHQFLSAINPLQYLPVVGTIYRAVTGDAIPEALRDGGSALVSGLLGGPIGLITSIVTTLVEKATGIDPEKIVAAELRPTPSAKPPTVRTSEKVVAVVAQPEVPAPRGALTTDQLSAYGVRSDASGTLKLGDSEGADALNGVELVRLSEVAAAYAATQARSPGLKPG